MWLLLVGLVLVLPVGVGAEHVIDWTYAVQPQDRDFVVESCVNRRNGCVMKRLATVSLTTRAYTHQKTQQRHTYCYQVGVRDSRSVYLWSNMVCTP